MKCLCLHVSGECSDCMRYCGNEGGVGASKDNPAHLISIDHGIDWTGTTALDSTHWLSLPIATRDGAQGLA